MTGQELKEAADEAIARNDWPAATAMLADAVAVLMDEVAALQAALAEPAPAA